MAPARLDNYSDQAGIVNQARTMDVIGNSIGFIGMLLAPLLRELKHLRNFEKRLEEFERKMEELVGQENDLKTMIETEMMHQKKKLKNEVELWLKNVDKLIQEASDMETKISENGRCVRSFFPNPFSRYKISKALADKVSYVTELQAKRAFTNGLFVDLLPTRGRVLPTTDLSTRRTSRNVSLVIWDYLMDVNINKLGIYGMGGVGKTTIMMHINNRLNDEQSFDFIYWVTLSKTFNIEKMQKDIAEAVGLDISDDENVTTRSALLFEHLQRKKFVLILDDMWHRFSLEEVGIPQPNKENGCKLVVITRLMEVCRGMETHREVKIDLLTKEEAWDLFLDKAGAEVTTLSPKLGPIAEAVSDKCGRLPLAIITVGRAMRKIEDIRVWKNALQELESSRGEIVGLEEDVFARLRFSYDHLKSDRTRACLLYCALYPEDYKIDSEELIEYWMVEGLIDEVGDREIEINKGYALLNELRDACLLESKGTRWVKMHDLVRDLAIRITKENPGFMIKAGMGLKNFPREWNREVERVSLMENSIKALPSCPNWPNLRTLLLQKNPLSTHIPSSFFIYMNSLKVLDLSSTQIELLPESLMSLCNLGALILRLTNIKNLPHVSALKELRVLDLSSTLLEELPSDIDKLVNLRRLDLSYTEELSSFPAGVLHHLSRLESLSVFRSNCKWSPYQGNNKGADFNEITNSLQLAHLGVSFENLLSFVSYVRSNHWTLLKSYHFGVGFLSSFEPISKGTFSVEIQGCNIFEDGNCIELPSNMQQLALQGCHDIVALSQLCATSNLDCLKECYISSCKALEFITTEYMNPFASLEGLVLRKLPKLKSLNFAPIQLKSLHVHNCNGLKHLFSLGLLQHLSNLEEFEVWNSNSIVEIVREEESSNSVENNIGLTIALLRLRHVYLSNLPELRCISRTTLICNSLQTIDIRNCENLRRLPFSSNYLPRSLNYIRASAKWWDELEWDEPTCKVNLQPFFRNDQD